MRAYQGLADWPLLEPASAPGHSRARAGSEGSEGTEQRDRRAAPRQGWRGRQRRTARRGRATVCAASSSSGGGSSSRGRASSGGAGSGFVCAVGAWAGGTHGARSPRMAAWLVLMRRKRQSWLGAGGRPLASSLLGWGLRAGRSSSASAGASNSSQQQQHTSASQLAARTTTTTAAPTHTLPPPSRRLFLTHVARARALSAPSPSARDYIATTTARPPFLRRASHPSRSGPSHPPSQPCRSSPTQPSPLLPSLTHSPTHPRTHPPTARFSSSSNIPARRLPSLARCLTRRPSRPPVGRCSRPARAHDLLPLLLLLPLPLPPPPLSAPTCLSQPVAATAPSQDVSAFLCAVVAPRTLHPYRRPRDFASRRA